MQVNLDENEVAAVLTAVQSYLSDLRSEINDTDNYDFKQVLKAQEAALTSVITKLGGSADDTDLDIGAKNPPWG
jgi:hypothetical protein